MLNLKLKFLKLPNRRRVIGSGPCNQRPAPLQSEACAAAFEWQQVGESGPSKDLVSTDTGFRQADVGLVHDLYDTPSGFIAGTTIHTYSLQEFGLNL